MAKKIRQKKAKISKTEKTVGHYLQIYFLALFAGVVVYTIGGLFIKTPIPCSNSKTCQSDLSVHIDNNATGTFNGHTVTPPKIDLSENTSATNVLGASTSAGEK